MMEAACQRPLVRAARECLADQLVRALLMSAIGRKADIDVTRSCVARTRETEWPSAGFLGAFLRSRPGMYHVWQLAQRKGLSVAMKRGHAGLC